MLFDRRLALRRGGPAGLPSSSTDRVARAGGAHRAGRATVGVLTPFGKVSLVQVHLVPPLPTGEVRTVRPDHFWLLPPRVVGMDCLAFPPRFLIVRAVSRFHHATSWPHSRSQPFGLPTVSRLPTVRP